MATPQTGPAAPRVSPPDLPQILVAGAALHPRAEAFQVRWDSTQERTDAAHSGITECVLADVRAERLDLTGATLVDVVVDAPRVTALSARDARWRRVLVSGGRIGTLDLAGAELDEVELRGIRIDYLSLAASAAQDLLIVDCLIGTLDIPQARLSRVAFAGSRADEVDTRGLRGESLDLRGLDALRFLDLSSLRGATISEPQAEMLAVDLARALGIDVRA